MKPSSVYSIIGAVATLGALAGGVIAVDDRYAHEAVFDSFVMDYQADRIENTVDKIQQRIWQLQDRRDVEKKAKKDTTDLDNQIKDLGTLKDKEQQKLQDYKKKN